ncbi:MAG: DUF126 domain-containing protein [Pseudomonadota bacterium]
MTSRVQGLALVNGQASGPLLILDEPISFWGGVDPSSGEIIDRLHPQCGHSIRGTILLLPGTRGSTAGPGALLETLFNANGPSGVLLAQDDLVTLIGSTLIQSLQKTPPPVVKLTAQPPEFFITGTHYQINDAWIQKLTN